MKTTRDQFEKAVVIASILGREGKLTNSIAREIFNQRIVSAFYYSSTI